MLVIDVRLKNYGSEMIEVIDNGCGVDEPNFQALSMSKLFHILIQYSGVTIIIIIISLASMVMMAIVCLQRHLTFH